MTNNISFLPTKLATFVERQCVFNSNTAPDDITRRFENVFAAYYASRMHNMDLTQAEKNYIYNAFFEFEEICRENGVTKETISKLLKRPHQSNVAQTTITLCRLPYV